MIPGPIIDRIFARLAARYGDDWTRKWEGIDVRAVKADWAAVLARVDIDAIAYALDYLPTERPPTSTAFRELCSRAPHKPQPALEAPRPDPARVAGALERMRGAIAKRHPLQWALDLQARDRAGEAITPAQRFTYQTALQDTNVEAPPGMCFDAIPPESLPPGMRPQEPRACQSNPVRSRSAPSSTFAHGREST